MAFGFGFGFGSDFDGGYYSTAAGNYLGFESSGLAIDFTNDSALVRWPGGTPYSGNTAGLLNVVRASTKWVTNAAGLLVSVANNVLGLDYDPVSLVALGALIEEQRTNLWTYSTDPTNAAWITANATITANSGAAPDGTNTLCLYQTTASGETRFGRSGGTTNSTAYAASIFAKYGNANGRYLWYRDFYANKDTCFDLQSGVVVSAASGVTALITSLGGGVYRCSASLTEPAAAVVSDQQFWDLSSSSSNVALGVAGGNCYIWGLQREAGAFPTSYIPTTSSQVTRAADQVTMPMSKLGAGAGNAFGTQVAQFDILDYPAGGGHIGGLLGIGISSMREYMTLTAGANRPFNSQVYDGTNATGVNPPNSNDLTINTLHKAAHTWSSANGGANVEAIDGAASAITNNATSIALNFSGLNMFFGGRPDTTAPLNGHLRRMKFLPRSASSAEMVAFTS